MIVTLQGFDSSLQPANKGCYIAQGFQKTSRMICPTLNPLIAVAAALQMLRFPPADVLLRPGPGSHVH